MKDGGEIKGDAALAFDSIQHFIQGTSDRDRVMMSSLLFPEGRPGVSVSVRDLRALLATPPLVWSSEPPKVPGDYHVEFGPNHKGIEYFSEADIRAKAWRPGSLRFAGPIPEPVEPEGGE